MTTTSHSDLDRLDWCEKDALLLFLAENREKFIEVADALGQPAPEAFCDEVIEKIRCLDIA